MIRSRRVALVAMAAWLAVGAGAVEPGPKSGAAPAAAGTDLSETDMSHVGTTPEGTVTVPWTMLGGLVGNKKANGVQVALYVLQAQDFAKLKPGEPNHAFTVALKDEVSGEFLKQGEVSIAVFGDDVAQRGKMAEQPNGLFRFGVRLPRAGDYRLKISFMTGGRSGQVEFPFAFSPDAQPAQVHQH